MPYFTAKWRALLCLGLLLLPAGSSTAQEFAARTLSLDDAIGLALKSNVDFVVTRQDVAIAASQIEAASGAYAPHFVLDLHYAYNHSPGSVFRTEMVDQQLVLDAAVGGRWLTTGLDYKLGLNYQYESNDSAYVIYNPTQTLALRLDLNQPLLRDAGSKVNRAPIVVAAMRRDESKNLLQAQIERVLAGAEVAYWTLVLAIKEREVHEQTLAVERQQVEDTQKQVKLGAGAPIDILESQAAVANTLDEIQALNQQLAETEGQLLALIQPQLDARFTAIVPSETAETRPVAGTLEEHWATAHKRRPDLIAARQELDATKVLEEVARNQLLPRVDVVGNVGLTGFAGTMSRGFGTAFFGQPLDAFFPDRHTVPPYTPDRALEGNTGTMFENLRYASGMIGVRVDAALDNRQAIGQHHAAEARVKRQDATISALERQVDYQVLTAYKRVLADQERLRLTGDAVRIAEGLLEGQQKRFRNGVAVAFDVLRATANVARARIEQVRALVSCRISQARLALAEGTYLDQRGIKLQ